MFNLKKQFLLDPSVTFLNHGSFGATPKPVFAEYQRWQRELENQPVEFLGRCFNDLMRTAREALATYLGTSAQNVIYAQNVTVALNIVARSLELGIGDEVLTTNHEYGAMDRTWRFLAKERGFAYINQPVDLTSADAFVDSFWRGVTAKTRVIFLSHITSPTATIFPVREIIQRAREKNILTIIDGAHVAGQIPLNLDELGSDFYGGNLHKVRLAPNAFLPLVIGKILAGLTATAANMTVTLALAVALFGLRIPPDRWLSLAVIGFGVALAASGIGLGVGAWFRDYRTIQPLLIVTVAGSFFAAGGYASVPTLPPFVQAFDVYWPIAYVFETLQGIMHSADAPSLLAPMFWAYAAAILGLGVGIFSVRKVI